MLSCSSQLSHDLPHLLLGDLNAPCASNQLTSEAEEDKHIPRVSFCPEAMKRPDYTDEDTQKSANIATRQKKIAK